MLFRPEWRSQLVNANHEVTIRYCTGWFFVLLTVFISLLLPSNMNGSHKWQRVSLCENVQYSIQLSSTCIYILEMKWKGQGRKNPSSWYLQDLVNAALTVQMTGWSGARTHSPGNGSAGRLQEGQVLCIKHRHTQIFLTARLKVLLPGPQVTSCSAQIFWNKVFFSVSYNI